MRSSAHLTATLLMAAVAAVGCSKSEQAPSSAVSSRNSGLVKPVSMTDDPSSAKSALNRAFDVPPVKPAGPPSFADGEAAYKAGNYSEAVSVFEQYTTEKPDNAWGHFMLGLSAWKSGEPRKAETAFEEALRIDPDHLKSLLNLSRVLIDEQRYDDAVEKLELAGNIDPNSGEVHRLLGRAYAAQGRTDDAADAYRAAIALDNKDAWAMNNLGLLFIEQGRFSEAVLPLARAVELRNEIPSFHNNLGMALEHTGRFMAAAVEYNGALAADPGYEKAKQNLARVEAVKVNSEEPFDLQATAQHFVETIKTTADESVAVQ